MKINFNIYINTSILLILISLISCGKTDIELTMERGQIHFEQGNNSEAIIAFKTVIKKLDGTNIIDEEKLLAKAYENLAIAYSKINQNEQALEQAKKAFNLIHPQIDSLVYIKSLIEKRIN